MLKKTPASLIKRVEKLENSRGMGKCCPVAMFPRLVSVDEWGELASQMQAILKDNIKMDSPPNYNGLLKQELIPSR